MLGLHKEDMRDLTAIISTHNRKDALEELIKSLLNHYPDIPIIIVDSSTNKISKISKNHIIVDPDSGISLQRNIALDKVKTNLFLLLDDDYVFNNDTQIEKLVNQMIIKGQNIVGGKINNINGQNFEFHGYYEIINNILYHFIDHLGDTEEKKYDTIFNFFVGKTNLIKASGGWNNNLKFAREHDDFFLNIKEHNLNVGYTERVSIDHKVYKKYHGLKNSEQCIKNFLEKWKIINKVEIRLIKNEDPLLTYISYHNTIIKQDIIPIEIKILLKQKYGDFKIKIS